MSYSRNGKGYTKPLAGAYPDPLCPLWKNLHGCWLFNEGAGIWLNDLSGNQNRGGLVNFDPNCWTGGPYGTALSGADSSNQYIACTSNANLDNWVGVYGFTVITHVKITSQVGHVIFSKIQSNGTNGWEFKTASTNAWEFVVDYTGGGSTNMNRRVQSNETYAIDQWGTLAFTWDGSTSAANVHVYWNGVEPTYNVTTDGVGTPPVDGNFNFGLFNRVGGTANEFGGAMSYCYLWRRVLTVDEILKVTREPFDNFLRPAIRRFIVPAGGDVILEPDEEVAVFSQQALTVVADCNVALGVQSLTVTQQDLTIVGEASVTPGVQSVVVAQQALTVTADANVSEDVQMVVASQQDPTVIGDAIVSQGVQSATFSAISPVIEIAVPIDVQSATFSAVSPQVNTDCVISLGVQTVTSSQLDPTIVISVLPGVQEATFSVQDPTVVGDANVLPGVQSATVNAQSPTVSADANSAHGVQTATFSVQDPTVSGTAVVTPNAQSATFNAQAPTVIGDASEDLDAQEATLSQEDPTVVTGTGVIVTPDEQSATFSVQDPTVSGEAVVLPNVQTATVSAQSPTVSADAIVVLGVQSLTVEAPDATVETGLIVPQGVQSATFNAQDPAVSGSDVTTPAAQSAIFSVQAPTVLADANVAQDVQSATFNLNDPTVLTELNAIVSLGAQSVTVSVQTPVISGSATVSPDVQQGTFNSQSPVVSTTSDVVIALGVQICTVTQVDPTVSVGTGVIIDLLEQSLTGDLASPEVRAAALVQPVVLILTGSLTPATVSTEADQNVTITPAPQELVASAPAVFVVLRRHLIPIKSRISKQVPRFSGIIESSTMVSRVRRVVTMELETDKSVGVKSEINPKIEFESSPL